MKMSGRKLHHIFNMQLSRSKNIAWQTKSLSPMPGKTALDAKPLIYTTSLLGIEQTILTSCGITGWLYLDRAVRLVASF